MHFIKLHLFLKTAWGCTTMQVTLITAKAIPNYSSALDVTLTESSSSLLSSPCEVAIAVLGTLTNPNVVALAGRSHKPHLLSP